MPTSDLGSMTVYGPWILCSSGWSRVLLSLSKQYLLNADQKGDYAQGVRSVTRLMESGSCPHSLFSGRRCTGGCWTHPHGADHTGAELVPLPLCWE